MSGVRHFMNNNTTRVIIIFIYIYIYIYIYNTLVICIVARMNTTRTIVEY